MVFEVVRGYIQLASGLTEVTRARATEVAQGLLSLPAAGVASGGQMAVQVGALAEELLAAAATNRQNLAALVRSEVDVAVNRLGLVSAEKLEESQAEVARLRAEVIDLRSAPSKATARTTAPKRTAPKRTAAGKTAAKATGAKSTVAKTSSKKVTAAKTSPKKVTAAKTTAAKTSPKTAAAKTTAAKTSAKKVTAAQATAAKPISKVSPATSAAAVPTAAASAAKTAKAATRATNTRRSAVATHPGPA